MLDIDVIPEEIERLEAETLQTLQEKLLTGIQLQFAAKPVVKRLTERLDEAICLAVPSGEQLLIVDMVPSSRLNELSSLVGKRYLLNQSTGNDYFVEEIIADCCQAGTVEERRPSKVAVIKVPLWNGQQKVCGWLCLVGLVERLPCGHYFEY